MGTVLICLALFVGAFTYEIFGVMFVMRTTEHKALKAGIICGSQWLIGGLMQFNYVHNIALLIPAILGGTLGTIITILWEKKTQDIAWESIEDHLLY